MPVNTSNPLFVYEPNKCVLCGRCVRACCELREVGVLRYRERDGEFYVYTADDAPAGRVRLPLLRSLRRGLSHRGHPGQRGAAARQEPQGGSRSLQEQLPGGDRRAPVRPLHQGGRLRRGRRGDQREGPLPTSAGLRLRPSLRERMPPRRGQSAHRHQGAQALRGGTATTGAGWTPRWPPRLPPRSGWPWSAPDRPA